MMLYEKYRPQSLKDFVGQEKIKGKAELFLRRAEEEGDGAIFISGPSGTGKTTLAWILARALADDLFITELDGDKCGVDDVRNLEYSLSLCTPGGKWRVVIVNEAHNMTSRAVQAWLTTLEKHYHHSLIIFTTTRDMEEGLFGEASGPLASRCRVWRFTNQGLAQAMAERACEIARTECMDGQPLPRYLRLVQDCKNNMREVLQRIADGEMMETR